MITTIDSGILQKIDTLWKDRNMVSFCKACNTTEKQAKVIQDIISQIQYVIYMIDDQFEKNTFYGDSKMNALVEQGKNEIEIILKSKNIDTSIIQPLINFRHMEIDMRMYKNNPTCIKSPLDYQIAAFYRLKSCDIELARKIITAIAGKESYYTRDVTRFDQLGEVLDDFMDVEEDMNVINANRFLISLVKKGVAETIEEYYNFISPNLNILVDNSNELHNLGLDVPGLKKQLTNYLCRDWSGVKYSKTNELLFGK